MRNHLPFPSPTWKKINHCRLSLRFCSLISLYGLGLLGADKSQAADIYWDGTGTSWNAVASWSTLSGAADSNPPNVPGSADIAFFNISTVNTPQIVNLNGAQSALGLSFTSSDTVSLQSGTPSRILTLGASGITKTGTGAITIGSVVSNQNVTLELSANQSWINNNNTGAINVLNGVAPSTAVNRLLTLDGTSTAANTVSGVIANNNNAGVMSLTKAGTGTWVLSGANTYSGVTTINGGTLSVATIGDGGVAGNLGQATNAAANLVIGNGTLQYTGATATTNRAFTITAGQTATFDITANNLTVSGASANTTGALTKTGAGILTLSGANGHTGLTTVSAGTLAYGANNALSSGAVTVGGGILDIKTFTDTVGAVTLTAGSINGTTGVLTGTSYTLNGAGNTSVSAILAGAVSLTKSNTGTATLSGNNTYTGLTDVQAGTLTLGASDVFANTSTVKVSGGILALGANNDTVAGVQVTGGSITGSGTLTSTTAFDLQAGTISANLGGSVGVNKTTAGTVTLSGANSYSGSTTITSGTLLMGGSNVLPNSAVVMAGGTLSAPTSGTNTDITGALSMTASSVIDMGAGTNSLTFASLGSLIGTLSIWNWTGTANTINGTDQLNFDTGTANTLHPAISFYSGANGVGFIGTGIMLTGSGGLELVPVPEPGALFAGLALLAPLAWRERRHWMRCRDARVA